MGEIKTLYTNGGWFFYTDDEPGEFHGPYKTVRECEQDAAAHNEDPRFWHSAKAGLQAEF